MNMYNLLPTAKCPSCSKPATQPQLSEKCLLIKQSSSDSIDSLLSTCTKPGNLKAFYRNGIGEDPCMNCLHNQITETPGSFVKMKPGLKANTWLEIHQCPNCQTNYSVDAATCTVTAINRII